jgi:putative alpha-1,2-mannosidase
LIRHIADTFFTNKPSGLCGNEDAGEMSAWYVFSAMGFYPVNPANGTFVFGSPLIKKSTINLPGNKQFTITASNQSKQNKYIQKATLNGQPYTRSYIRYEDVVRGGELVLEMGAQPSSEFGVKVEDRPKSGGNEVGSKK